MAATAPFCNVTVFAPAPGPKSPVGFRLLSPNATLAEVIAVVNNNFSPQVQDDEFIRRLARDIQGLLSRPTQPTQFQIRSSGGSRGQIPKAINDKLSEMVFTEKSIVRKKIRVENPDDANEYIIDDRVVSLLMRDKTGATWVFQDKKSAGATSGGFNPDTTNSGG